MKMKILLALEETTVAQPLKAPQLGQNPQDYIIFLEDTPHRWSDDARVSVDQSRTPGSIVNANQWFLKIKKSEILRIAELLQKTQ